MDPTALPHPGLHRLGRRLLAALLAACAAMPAGATAADEYAERIWVVLNSYRQQHGLSPLRPAPALVALAAEHSRRMTQRGKPSHDGFADRFERAGSEVCVENVAQGFRIPEQVLIGWRRMPAHHRNVLDPTVNYAGIAVDGAFVTYFACSDTGAAPR